MPGRLLAVLAALVAALVSTSAERAARRIVRGLRRGDGEVVIITAAAWVAARLHGLVPGTTATLMSLAPRVLPPPGGIGRGRALGHESESRLAPSLLTTLTERAARRNNQIPGIGAAGAR